jgi:uncharacterized membrane protein
MTMEDTPQGPPDAPPPEPPPEPPPAAPPPEPPPPDQPTRAVPTAKASDNRTIWVVLSYLGLLALIPLLVEREDQEVQWHAKHGLVLLVAEVVLFVGIAIVNAILGSVLPVLGCLGCFLPAVLMIAILVLHILCIVKGVKGERFLVPWVSDFVDKF